MGDCWLPTLAATCGKGLPFIVISASLVTAARLMFSGNVKLTCYAFLTAAIGGVVRLLLAIFCNKWAGGL